MKKIFWTTIFWLVVFFGFVFYMKSFDANTANKVSTWIGATSVAVQDTLATGDQMSVMSGILDIQSSLVNIQATLNTLAGETPVVTPTVSTTGTVTTK